MLWLWPSVCPSILCCLHFQAASQDGCTSSRPRRQEEERITSPYYSLKNGKLFKCLQQTSSQVSLARTGSWVHTWANLVTSGYHVLIDFLTSNDAYRADRLEWLKASTLGLQTSQGLPGCLKG